MTDAAALLALADRVEAAEAPSRELDAEIHETINGRVVQSVESYETIFSVPGRYWFNDVFFADPPPFTASIDAALTLVPDDSWWFLGKETSDGPLFQAQILDALLGDRVVVEGKSDTSAALALCAAALRAIASTCAS